MSPGSNERSRNLVSSARRAADASSLAVESPMCTISGTPRSVAAALAVVMISSPAVWKTGPTMRSLTPAMRPGLCAAARCRTSLLMSSRDRTSAGPGMVCAWLPAFTITATRVLALGRMCAGKTPRLATPTDPQSTTVVTPDRTPMSSGSHMPIPTPSVIAPAATWVCRSISPGTTCRPAPWISTTRCASSGGMPAAILVILPSVIAISRMPSSPWPGSRTWPPLISRS